MRIFVLRHGEAEYPQGRDADRKLTPTGEQQTRNILSRSHDDLQQVTRIFASPYVRAQQTAQLVSETLELPVETVDLLTPDGGILALMAFLEQHQSEVAVLVSHQPLVGNLVDWLCAEPRGRHFMGTSALALIDMDVLAKGCADLIWLRQP